MPESGDALAVITEFQRGVAALSARPTFPLSELTELMQDIHRVATEWESNDRLTDAVAMYEEISRAYEIAAERVEPEEREFLTSLRDFWRTVVETKRHRIVETHQNIAAQTISRSRSRNAPFRDSGFQHQAAVEDSSFSVPTYRAHFNVFASEVTGSSRNTAKFDRVPSRSSTLDETLG